MKEYLGTWNLNFLPNKIREFSFKFYGNILGLNSRVAHFGININPGCTFCRLTIGQAIPSESFLHLFFECPSVVQLHDSFVDQFLDIDNLSLLEKKRLWFFGELKNWENDKKINIFLLTCVTVFNFLVWESKLQKKIRSFNSIKMDFHFLLNKIIFSSSLIRHEKNKLNYPLCRFCDER